MEIRKILVGDKLFEEEINDNIIGRRYYYWKWVILLENDNIVGKDRILLEMMIMVSDDENDIGVGTIKISRDDEYDCKAGGNQQ